MATTPQQRLSSIETVLKDVRTVLRAMHEDKANIQFVQRSQLSGCLDEIAHALDAIEDDESGLRGTIERLTAIESRVEPLRTKQWERFRGSLLQCLHKAADTYFYTTQEGQGDHDWRIRATGLKQRKEIFRLTELLARITAQVEQSNLPAILDYDTSWLGESIYRENQTEPLWVFAKIYIVGDHESVAPIERVDFEKESHEQV